MEDAYENIYNLYNRAEWQAKKEIEKYLFEADGIVDDAKHKLWKIYDKIGLIIKQNK